MPPLTLTGHALDQRRRRREACGGVGVVGRGDCVAATAQLLFENEACPEPLSVTVARIVEPSENVTVLDHVVPVTAGGAMRDDNIACGECNLRKGIRWSGRPNADAPAPHRGGPGCIAPFVAAHRSNHLDAPRQLADRRGHACFCAERQPRLRRRIHRDWQQRLPGRDSDNGTSIPTVGDVDRCRAVKNPGGVTAGVLARRGRRSLGWRSV